MALLYEFGLLTDNVEYHNEAENYLGLFLLADRLGAFFFDYRR
jgi:hypothetical protein